MTRALGCDISFWNSGVDFAKMVSAGAKFCYVKASQQTPDSRFAEYWPNAKKAGILRGAYHYLDWRISELVQAKLFTDTMNGDWGELPPVLDLEMNPAPYNLTLSPQAEFGMNLAYKKNPQLSPEKEEVSYLQSTNYELAPKEVQGKVWNFLQAVEKTTGRIPIVYSGYFYWNQWMTPDPAWSKYPFWLAWYENESVIKVPPPWTKWTFWQYTGNGNGPQYGSQGLSLDMDWFNGTEDELRAFASVPVPIPPAPAPTHPSICPTCGQPWPQAQTPWRASVTMNVRSAPDSSVNNIIGTLSQGTIVYVDDQSNPLWVHLIPFNLFPRGGWCSKSYIFPL